MIRSLFGGDTLRVPKKFYHKSCGISVKKKQLTISLVQEYKAFDVFFLECLPAKLEADEAPTIIFIHDRDSSSKMWDDIGSMTLVAAMGYRAVAFDLPQHGRTEGGSVCNKAAFLQAFISGADIQKPIIVGADIAGQYVIAYLLEHSGRMLGEKVKACISVALTDTEQLLLDERAKHVHIPVISIYGSDDEDMGGSSARNMAATLPDHSTSVVVKAPHRCYVNETAKWDEHLYNALIQIERRDACENFLVDTKHFNS